MYNAQASDKVYYLKNEAQIEQVKVHVNFVFQVI